jgi:hypothetical protein
MQVIQLKPAQFLPISDVATERSAMNVSATSPASASTAITQAQVAESAQVFVLKKATDLQAASVMTLLQALPLATSGSLGTKVNTLA